MKKLTLIGVFVILAVIAFKLPWSSVEAQLSTAINVPTFGYGPDLEDQASTTAFTLGNSSTRILATSTQRWYAIISNTGTSSVYLNINNDNAAADDTGILLTASSTFTINKDNLWQGSVTAISPRGTDALTVTELRRKQ